MGDFRDRITAILLRGGDKGYTGCLRQICQGLPHALGEAVYKIVRYNKLHDPQDLVKAAAWLEMEYNANTNRSRAGDEEVENVAWPADQGLISRIAHSRAGDAGGDARGQLDAAFAQAVRRLSPVVEPIAGRASPSRRRRKPVDNKYRPRKGKGRS